MNPRRVFAVFLRQFYLMRGNFQRFLTLFIWVVLDIILWGFMTRYLNGMTGHAYNFVPAILGAVLLWGFMNRVMMGVAMAFMEDCWARNFLNVFASPVTIGEYVSGLVLSGIASSAIGLAIMLALATLIFGLSVFAYGLMVFPFLLVLFMCGIALGVFAVGMMLRLGPAGEWLVWPLPAVFTPFVGVFYPLSVLPHWMRTVAWILPPSYVFEGIRAIAGGHAVAPAWLVWAVVLAIFYMLLAALFFMRTYRTVVRTGQLARYSAEAG
ncbi:MAG: ABC transporter permease [Alphaproteobacteria bacterium]|nr:ABC transporter permease [Alphaproteobacteria bacterium]